jgi:glycosyltransferase involved in cell wall biosynthesis
LRGRCLLDIVTREPVAAEPGVRVHHGLTPDSPRLRQLYREATAFVLPTRGDFYPIALIEAMGMGLPVVTSAMAGIPEMVEPGRSGYLVPPDDGNSLRASLEAIVSDPVRARTMGQRGRDLAEQRFDARKTAERLLDLVTSVAPCQVRRSSH